MLATQSSLNPVRALPQAIPSLVAYLQVGYVTHEPVRCATELRTLRQAACELRRPDRAHRVGRSVAGMADNACLHPPRHRHKPPQNQRHSTNLDELQTLGCRIGQVLAAALDGASAGGGQDWAVSDTRPQLDARGGGSYAAAYAASKGPVAADASPCHVDPAWALNHVLLPLLRVACR